jgi:hypothetical protein
MGVDNGPLSVIPFTLIITFLQMASRLSNRHVFGAAMLLQFVLQAKAHQKVFQARRITAQTAWQTTSVTKTARQATQPASPAQAVQPAASTSIFKIAHTLCPLTQCPSQAHPLLSFACWSLLQSWVATGELRQPAAQVVTVHAQLWQNVS